MVDTLWPANAVTGAPSYNGRMLRQAGGVALAGATAARPLGARSGVRPGTSTATVTATSTTWTCGPFAGVADVMTAAEAGAYEFAFDANATGAVTAAHATLPRKDIIYVSITDPAESVGATVTVTRKYLAGTAAASPVAPAIPGTERGFVVAEISVPASGGGSPSVAWVAPYAVAAGGVLPVRDQAELNGINPTPGQLVYRNDAKCLMEYVDGVTPSWYHAGGRPFSFTITFAGGYSASGTSPARLMDQAGRLHLEGIVVTASTTFTAGVNTPIGTIPSAYAPAETQSFVVVGSGIFATLVVTNAGAISFIPSQTFTAALSLTLAGANWRNKGL